MTDMQKNPASIRLWMRIVFFISLAINLLVVGALVGLMIAKPSIRDRRVHSTRNLVQPFIRALEPHDRKLFIESMERVWFDDRGQSVAWGWWTDRLRWLS